MCESMERWEVVGSDEGSEEEEGNSGECAHAM